MCCRQRELSAVECLLPSESKDCFGPKGASRSFSKRSLALPSYVVRHITGKGMPTTVLTVNENTGSSPSAALGCAKPTSK